jgi:hypothetical protein
VDNTIGYLTILILSCVGLSTLFYHYGKLDGFDEAYQFFEKELP